MKSKDINDNIKEKTLWNKVPLGDISKVQNGYSFKSKQFSNKGNPVIKIKNVNGRVVNKNDCQLYPFELCEKLDRYRIFNNDVLIAMTGAGSVGRVSKFLNTNLDTKYYLNQRVGKIIPDKNSLNNEFLYQIISSKKYEQILFDSATGSGQPNLSPSIIGSIEIPLPPLKNQGDIADTLSALDIKIELNNKINENLEEQAQAIFKHWFVDFEFPNENGKPYKSSGGQMIESELGRIPKGWEVIKLENLVENTKTGNWGKGKKEGNYTEEILCLRGADIPEIKKGNEGSMPKRYIIPKNLEEKALEDGDIVVEMSGGSPTQSTGRSVYINKELLDSYPVPLLCTNFCRVLNVKKEYKKMFYYNWEYLYSLGHMFSFENGTTGIKNLDLKSLLENNKITNPSTKILLKFNKYISTINTNKIKLGTQNQKLSQLRDTLLPKLMNGEIRIPLD